MVPYAPIDGPDHRFGQINRPLSKDAYKNAGLEGFLPSQPFESFQPSKDAGFDDDHIPISSTGDEESAPQPTMLIDFQTWNNRQAGDEDLHFPTLWELNEELDNWGDIPVDIETYVDNRMPISSCRNATFTSKITPLPTAAHLASKIVSSKSKLFFISWKAPASSRREWHLVRVNLESSLSLNPECLHNGKFLVEFFICHPKDRTLHPRNQRWWLEYHASSSVARLHQGDFHILRPDAHSSNYAEQNQLFPFCQWVNLLHEPTYIHGPFEFAVISGRQTRDRVLDIDWMQLIAAKEKYDDAAPHLNQNDYLGVQFSRNFHTSFYDSEVQERVMATHFLQPESYSITSL